jgi:hypothetical protein
MATQAEIEADLLIVSTAITKLINKESVSRVELGSGASRTVYQFQEISFEMLSRERDRLTRELEAVVGGESKTFRTTSRMQMTFSK